VKKKQKKHDSGEVNEMKDKYLRALADLDNMKKRSAIEREEIIRFANETLIAALLPIFDSFDRALKSFEGGRADEEVIKGIALIKKQFEDALARAGVSRIECLGSKFDPHLHEAVMRRKSDKEEDTVLEIMQSGYALHGKVIRPAMVIISEKEEKQ